MLPVNSEAKAEGEDHQQSAKEVSPLQQSEVDQRVLQRQFQDEECEKTEHRARKQAVDQR